MLPPGADPVQLLASGFWLLASLAAARIGHRLAHLSFHRLQALPHSQCLLRCARPIAMLTTDSGLSSARSTICGWPVARHPLHHRPSESLTLDYRSIQYASLRHPPALYSTPCRCDCVPSTLHLLPPVVEINFNTYTTTHSGRPKRFDDLPVLHTWIHRVIDCPKIIPTLEHQHQVCQAAIRPLAWTSTPTAPEAITPRPLPPR